MRCAILYCFYCIVVRPYDSGCAATLDVMPAQESIGRRLKVKRCTLSLVCLSAATRRTTIILDQVHR